LSEHSAIGLASSYALLGRYDEAANAWLPLVASLPDSIPVRTACAWNLVQAGRATEAAELLKKGLERHPDPRLWTGLARAYHAGAGSPAEAMDAIERGDGSDPELADSIRTAATGAVRN
jgi:predicted Zn-dependent protease